MANEQQATLDAILRQSAFPADADVDEQRRLLRALLSAQPLPGDVTVTAAQLGEVPVAEITVDGIAPRHVVLYFHGGVYVMGDAARAAELASQVARRTRARAISVDYRLAPEHPYPAAVDDALAAYAALLEDGISPSHVVFAGGSAGGGLAVATLVNARDRELPLPAAAYVMSPYADLTLAGTTIDSKSEVDPLLSRAALQARIQLLSTSRRRSSMTRTDDVSAQAGPRRELSGAAHFAYSTARDSRMTVTLIWPGYSSSFSISRAISWESTIAASSSIAPGWTMTRISRPACIA
jgi:acetyl esterase/lipase